MSPTRYSIGDVISFGEESFLVVGIDPAPRNPDRLRYELVGDANRTLFRYVDVFDERDDVELVLGAAEVDDVLDAVAEAEAEPKADDAADAELEDEDELEELLDELEADDEDELLDDGKA